MLRILQVWGLGSVPCGAMHATAHGVVERQADWRSSYHSAATEAVATAMTPLQRAI